MQLDHEFAVPVPITRAWPILLDLERIAPCLPGAQVTAVESQVLTGKVRVKVGSMVVTYRGTVTVVEADELARRAVIEARGEQMRGSGTANARVTTVLHGDGDKTRVTVSTDLSITGRPAQLDRNVLADVGAKLLGQFADRLAEQLAVPPAGGDPAGLSGEPAAGSGEPAGPATQPGGATVPAGPPPHGTSPDSTAPGVTGPGRAAIWPAQTAAADAGPAEVAEDDAAGDAAVGVAAEVAGGAAGLAGDASGAAAAGRASEPAAGVSAGSAAVTPIGAGAEVVDLLGTASIPFLKRLAPILAALAMLAALVAVLRRTSRRS